MGALNLQFEEKTGHWSEICGAVEGNSAGGGPRIRPSADLRRAEDRDGSIEFSIWEHSNDLRRQEEGGGQLGAIKIRNLEFQLTTDLGRRRGRKRKDGRRKKRAKGRKNEGRRGRKRNGGRDLDTETQKESSLAMV